jgi:hypothetical protein
LASGAALGLFAGLSALAAPSYGPFAPSDWANLGKLPDFSGVWAPDAVDQVRQESTNPPPWIPAVAAQMAKLKADERAGHPFLVLKGCLPYGMPSIMLMTHNAMEFLFTPGRVTILGESDGNRLRRIYTDGRKHPDDPDLTMFGHSIGHWEGQTLVVDTVAIAPQAYLAISESLGIPSDGDMHVVERIHLAAKPDVLDDDLTITDPKILSGPWTTTRVWRRVRGEAYDIEEGECEQGMVRPAKDANGHDVFVPAPVSQDGSVVPAHEATR